MKVTILEQLLADEVKTKHLVDVLNSLKLRIEFTSDSKWFNIVPQRGKGSSR